MSGNDEKKIQNSIPFVCPHCGSSEFLRGFIESGVCKFSTNTKKKDYSIENFEWDEDDTWRCCDCDEEVTDELLDHIREYC